MEHILNIEVNENGARNFLNEHRWPVGLQNTIIGSMHKIPIRYFIIDNSYSMETADGHVVREVPGEEGEIEFKNEDATRWEELMDSVLFHAKLAHYARAPIKFVFICPYKKDLPTGSLLIDGGEKSEENLALLQKVLNMGPNGLTPICAAIANVVKEVVGLLPSLAVKQQGVVINIGSDGAPSDGTNTDIVNSLKVFAKSPEVSLVFRLYTDDKSVVDFWNEIDEAIPELSIDVLDDLETEAQQVTDKKNDFIAYPLPLHRLREFGSHLQEMDIIDERQATPADVRVICNAIFGGDINAYPDPAKGEDFDEVEFIRFLSTLSAQVANVYNPAEGRMTRWVRETYLSTMFGMPGNMEICLNLPGGVTGLIGVNPHDTVHQVKKNILAEAGFNLQGHASLTLTHNGKELLDRLTIAKCNLPWYASIDVTTLETVFQGMNA